MLVLIQHHRQARSLRNYGGLVDVQHLDGEHLIEARIVIIRGTHPDAQGGVGLVIEHHFRGQGSVGIDIEKVVLVGTAALNQ